MLIDAYSGATKMASYLNAENPLILRLRRYTVLGGVISDHNHCRIGTGFLGYDSLLCGHRICIIMGIIAFLFSFIPTIGFWLALIPPVILAYLQFWFSAAVLVFFGIVIINGFAEKIVKPRYMGVFFGWIYHLYCVFLRRSLVVDTGLHGSHPAIRSLSIQVLVLESDEGSLVF